MEISKTPFLGILIISFTAALGEENIVGSRNISSIDKHNGDYCNETQSWENLQHNYKSIKGVCIKKDYQMNEPPLKRNLTPLLVLDHMTKISSINEKGKLLDLDIKMRLMWEDVRIKSRFSDYMDFHRLPPITKDGSSLIWVPPTEIENLKSLNFLNDPIKFNWVLLFLSSPELEMFSLNTTLVHAFVEWHVTISCEFDFSRYPLDDQTCGFRMWLYDSMVTYEDMSLERKLQTWGNATPTHGFEITKLEIQPSVEELPGTGLEFGKFGYDLRMKRIVTPFIYQYYLPCGLIVVASCLSFIVPISATPGRIALVVTQFLTLTNLFINEKVCARCLIFVIGFLNMFLPSTTENVSYVIIFQSDSPAGSALSALDCYLLISMLFVFGTLVEFSLVLFLYQNLIGEDNSMNVSFDGLKKEPGQARISPEDENRRRIMKQLEMKINSPNLMARRLYRKSLIPEAKKKDLFRQLGLMRKIDFTCFFAFNFSYFVFNVIYWATYLK